MEHPKTTSEEDKIAEQEGYRIFGELRKKHSNNNIHDLDIVLNSLCAALTRLAHLNTRPDDYHNFIKLVSGILMKNLN